MSHHEYSKICSEKLFYFKLLSIDIQCDEIILGNNFHSYHDICKKCFQQYILRKYTINGIIQLFQYYEFYRSFTFVALQFTTSHIDSEILLLKCILYSIGVIKNDNDFETIFDYHKLDGEYLVKIFELYASVNSYDALKKLSKHYKSHNEFKLYEKYTLALIDHNDFNSLCDLIQYYNSANEKYMKQYVKTIIIDILEFRRNFDIKYLYTYLINQKFMTIFELFEIGKNNHQSYEYFIAMIRSDCNYKKLIDVFEQIMTSTENICSICYVNDKNIILNDMCLCSNCYVLTNDYQQKFILTDTFPVSPYMEEVD